MNSFDQYGLGIVVHTKKSLKMQQNTVEMEILFLLPPPPTSPLFMIETVGNIQTQVGKLGGSAYGGWDGGAVKL